MGGGLLQLVAYGAQDVYLTGNPQITFFKVVYRRHTNFSIETIEQLPIPFCISYALHCNSPILFAQPPNQSFFDGCVFQTASSFKISAGS